MEKPVAGKGAARQAPSLRELEILQAMIATRKTVAAAQMLGISPQAVSRSVHFLEQTFGEMLFIRNTRSTAITPFGEQVYREAQAALKQTDHLFQRFSLQERTREAGLVRVECRKPIISACCPPCCSNCATTPISCSTGATATSKAMPTASR